MDKYTESGVDIAKGNEIAKYLKTLVLQLKLAAKKL